MSRVLVTGASGLVGRHCLAPLMAEGFEVHAVSRRPAHTPGPIWHESDLLVPGAVDDLVASVRPEFVLHAAWYLEPGKYASSPLNVHWVGTTLHLLRAFAQAGGNRFLGIGSCFEYSWAEPLLREATPLKASTIYGRSKAALSELVDVFGEATGMSSAWARVFFLFGPYEDSRRLMGSVVSSLVAGQEALCTKGDQERDYMYVGDTGRALVALLQSEVTGAVNVASGRAVSVASLVRRAAELVGRPDLVRLGSLPSNPNDPPRLVASVDRLRNEVGWDDETPLDRALSETIDYWRGTLVHR